MRNGNDTPGHRAVVFTRRERAELLPVEVSGPSRGQISGSTVCSLVSPGTEINGGFRPGPERPVAYPIHPGYAAVFRVETVGAGVEGIAADDLVYAEGSHRSAQTVDAAAAIPLTEGLDPFAAVFTRLMAVPLTALTTTRAHVGARVGVSGLGIIGHLAAAIFAAAGYRVTAWDPHPERRASAPSGIDVLERSPEFGVPRQHGSLDGFEVVLECSGNDAAALDAVRSVRAGGEVVLVGTPWTRRSDTTAQVLLHEVFHRYAVLRSGWEFQLPRTAHPFGPRSAKENIAIAFDWLTIGRVDVSPLAVRVRPEDAQSVYSSLAQASFPALSAVFDWQEHYQKL